MYYRIKEYIYSDFGTISDPETPKGISFSTGVPVSQDFATEFTYIVDNPADEPPGAVMGINSPAFSNELLEVLKGIGVDNFQAFDAVLVNQQTRQKWENYSTVNIIGKIACADLGASKMTEIAKRPGDGLPLYKFHKLVIDPSKACDQLLFRLAEQPSAIVFHEKILDALDENPNPRGGKWKISCFPIDEI